MNIFHCDDEGREVKIELVLYLGPEREVHHRTPIDALVLSHRLDK